MSETQPTSKRASGTHVRAWTWLFPAMALVLLVVLPTVYPVRLVVDEATLARREAVATAVEDAPWIIGGRFTSSEVDVPPAAVKLLKPNAIFSRTFRDLESNLSFNLLIVHSTDVKDTTGHYPPICYPASGWVEEGDPDGSPVTLNVDGHDLSIKEYTYERMSEGGFDRQGIRVLNFFLLPDGSTTTSMYDIKNLASRRGQAADGVAQIQVVTSSRAPKKDVIDSAGRVLAGMPDVLNALGFPGESGRE